MSYEDFPILDVQPIKRRPCPDCKREARLFVDFECSAIPMIEDGDLLYICLTCLNVFPVPIPRIGREHLN